MEKQRDKSKLTISSKFDNSLKQGNKMEQIKNIIYIIKDTIGTRWYTDLAWF